MKNTKATRHSKVGMFELEEYEEVIPNPGSPEAIEQNCSCPVLDNGHGRGYMGNPNAFVTSQECVLHGD